MEDPTIPMWVIKCRGDTYYVHHVIVEPGIGFTTKETPDNPHTKGSIKFKANLVLESDENNNIIARLK